MTLQYPIQPSSIRDLWVSHQAIQACIAFCNWKSSPFLEWDGDSVWRSEFAHKQKASWIFLKWSKRTSAAPKDLLLGRTSRCVPQEPFEESWNPRKRFAFIQSRAHLFWRRFVGEYVPTLLCRSKWYTKGRQVKVGDTVLIVDYNSPRGKWDLTLVKQIYPGANVGNVLLMHQCSIEVEWTLLYFLCL